MEQSTNILFVLRHLISVWTFLFHSGLICQLSFIHHLFVVKRCFTWSINIQITVILWIYFVIHLVLSMLIASVHWLTSLVLSSCLLFLVVSLSFNSLTLNLVLHLLFFLTNLHSYLSSQFLLLNSIKITNNFQSWFKNHRCNKSTKSTHHVNNSTANEIHKSELLKPSLTPDPRCTDWIDYCGDVEAVDNMCSKMASLTHAWILYLYANQT